MLGVAAVQGKEKHVILRHSQLKGIKVLMLEKATTDISLSTFSGDFSTQTKNKIPTICKAEISNPVPSIDFIIFPGSPAKN